jgi:hypothetical protein
MFLGFAGIPFLGSVAQLLCVAKAHTRPGPNWDQLAAQVGGRLLEGIPFAQPCFSNSFTSSECMNVQDNYLDESEYRPRASHLRLINSTL